MLPDAPGNFDGFAQAFPVYSKINDQIEGLLNGKDLERWSWDVGLGAPFFDTFRSRLLNPITYLINAFPDKYLDIAYSIFAVFRQFLAGVAFIAFSREIRLSNEQRVIGALCYTFCGWIIYATCQQADFISAVIIFPLLIMGVDRILKDKSPLVFIISVVLCMSNSKLWIYSSGICVIVYYVFRYSFYKHDSSFIKTYISKDFIISFLKFCLYGITAILISSLMFIAVLYTTGNEVLNTNVEKYGLLYPIKNYLKLPSSFFGLTKIHTPYSILYAPVIIIALLPLTVKNAFTNRSTAARLFLLFFVISLFPITGKFFNGFSYVVSRWFYILAFFMCWAGIECFDREAFKEKKNIVICSIWLIVICAYNIIICYFTLHIISKSSMLATLIGLIFGLLILAVLYFKEHSDKKYHKPALLLATVILVVSVIGAANMTFFPYINKSLYRYALAGKTYDKFNSLSSQHIIPDIQKEDKGFYRTDQVDTNNDRRIARMVANMNIYSGNRSIYEYFSSANKNWFEFNKIVGNNAGYFDRTCVYSNDNRAALDYLMGVKYFIGDSDIKKPGANDYAPYGYSYYKTIDGIQVLKNKYCMGIGTSFDKYITRSEFMEYTPLEREQVLMQVAVVDDDTPKSLLNGVHHANKTEIKTDTQSIELKPENPEKDVKLKDNTILVYNGKTKFNVELPKIKNAQVVLAFENLVREKCDYKTKCYYSGKKPSDSYIKQQAFIDNERFRILVEKDRVRKNAINEKSKNQGFTDVKDYYINLGYYNEISGKVTAKITKPGKYTYDAIKAYSIPMDIYSENAKILDERSLKIDKFENEYISGTLNCKNDSILYLSILSDPGWHVKTDGQPAEKIKNLDIAFTGIRVPEGKHKIEIEYIYPGLKTGIVLTLIGLVMLAVILLMHRRKHHL